MAPMITQEHMRRLIPSPLLEAKRSVQRQWYQHRLRHRRPVITQSQGAPIPNAAHTAVILCGPYFDQRVPNANTKIRLGLAHGFEQVGIPYKFISLSSLRCLRDLTEPIVFLGETDYEFLSDSQARALRRYHHFVWVNPWYDEAWLYAEHPGKWDVSPEARARVLQSEPAFVFTPVSESCLEYYRVWERHGQRLQSLPLACDISLYERDTSPPKFSGVHIAFVGGYWPNKARNFDLYLKPYERELTVFGYAQWPYAGYGGQLAEEDEPRLYRDAVLSPAINEPHAAVTGDICERVYKVLGSGGLCVSDLAPGHRELFGKEELLVPESLDDYHDIVRAVLRDPEAFTAYREAGYQAVRSRHTYAHRAATVLDILGLPVPKSPLPPLSR